MAATIEIHGVTATARGYSWECEDATTRRLLSALIDPDGPLGADPDPDLTLAKAAVKRMGAKLVKNDPPPHVAGRVY